MLKLELGIRVILRRKRVSRVPMIPETPRTLANAGAKGYGEKGVGGFTDGVNELT